MPKIKPKGFRVADTHHALTDVGWDDSTNRVTPPGCSTLKVPPVALQRRSRVIEEQADHSEQLFRLPRFQSANVRICVKASPSALRRPGRRLLQTEQHLPGLRHEENAIVFTIGEVLESNASRIAVAEVDLPAFFRGNLCR